MASAKGAIHQAERLTANRELIRAFSACPIDQSYPGAMPQAGLRARLWRSIGGAVQVRALAAAATAFSFGFLPNSSQPGRRNGRSSP
jgi:hypothetical protein